MQHIFINHHIQFTEITSRVKYDLRVLRKATYYGPKNILVIYKYLEIRAFCLNIDLKQHSFYI